MTDTDNAFEAHDAYERQDDGFSLTTIPFDGRVIVEASRYRVTVRVPTLDAATDEPIADAVSEGWFETFCLRLADAPGVTRADIDVPEPTVERDGNEVVVGFGFDLDDPARAAATAKALSEYVEGTYVEGIIPGYSYLPPVADLLSRARQHGDGDDEGESAMPL